MNPTQTIAANPGALQAADAAMTSLDTTVDPGTKELVGQWRERLEHARRHDDHARQRYADDRRVARGETQWLVDTNLVGAILEILEAFVYAKDPDFAVDPAESVDKQREKVLGDACETLRIVVSRLLRQADLKGRGRRWVRSAQTVGVGWLRPSLTTHTEKDPVVAGEINTLQENLKRLDVLEAEAADGECGSVEAKRAEIEANLVALQAKLEKSVANGLVLDLMPAEDVQVAPDCGELVNYLDAPWIAYRLYKTKEQALAITGWRPEQIKRANVYTQRKMGADGHGTAGSTQLSWVRVNDAESQSVDGFVAFDEIWSKTDGVVYTMIDGITDRWARAPYAPMTGSRWYDAFLLPMHCFDGERHPQSDVHQLKSLQDEYGRTRSNFAETRKRSIPFTIWDAGSIDPAELGKITSAEANEHLAIQFTDGTQPMQNRVHRFAAPSIDPAVYSTQPITIDMEKVSGAQDAMQSSVSVEKTATEAQIQNNGFGARIGTRRDTLETVLGELGTWVAQVALQYLPEEAVLRIAGPAAVWPELTTDEVLWGYDITVKAGSTGKPNLEAKRAAWMTALPLVEKMATVVGNFRAQGPQMEWAAAPYVAMLETTFAVLDMRDDVEKFLPNPPPPDPMQMLMGAMTGGAPAAAAGPMQPQMDNIGTPDSTPAAPSVTP